MTELVVSNLADGPLNLSQLEAVKCAGWRESLLVAGWTIFGLDTPFVSPSIAIHHAANRLARDRAVAAANRIAQGYVGTGVPLIG